MVFCSCIYSSGDKLVKLQAKPSAVFVNTPVLLSAQIDAERAPRASPKIYVFSVECAAESAFVPVLLGSHVFMYCIFTSLQCSSVTGHFCAFWTFW